MKFKDYKEQYYYQVSLVPLLRDNPSSRRPTWLVLRLTVPTEKTINVNQYEEKIKQTYNYYIFLAFGSIYSLFTPFSKIFLGLNRGRGWGKDIYQKTHVPVSQSSSRDGSADITAI